MAIGQYDYYDLCDAFINQLYIKGKTAQGRMSFNGTKLYSYNSLLAILDTNTNTLLVDYEVAKYSNTSKRHFNVCYDSVPNYTVFQINLNLTSSQNLTLYLERLNIIFIQYHRARKVKYKNLHKIRLLALYNEAQSYIKYTNLDKRTKPYKQFKQFFNTMFEAKLL